MAAEKLQSQCEEKDKSTRIQTQLTHIWKSTGRQPHSHRTHQCARHNKQIGMRIIHTDTDLLDQRKDDERRNSVRYESSNDKYQGREYD